MILIGIITLSCRTPTFTSQGALVTHDIWDSLLQKHVNDIGLVDYKGFLEDKGKLDLYLNQLSLNPPEGPQWTKEDKLAYWINVYNAFTVKLITDHYPVSSIKEIKKGIAFVNSVWDIEFFSIGDQKMDLTTVEHGILRKVFDEPRIHFAINCASMSCPKLHDRAFIGAKIDEQLDYVTRQFINDENRNIIKEDRIMISKIFSWFKRDFTQKNSLIEFINQYSQTSINSNADIDHMDYDWSLNEVK